MEKTVTIHATAVIDPRAELGEGVSVGPYTVIGPDVRIGPRTAIGSHCVLEGWTEIGADCRITHSVCLGQEPQDVKYGGEETYVRIGSGNLIREYTSVHRATGEGNETRIGDDNFIMAYVHVAHNCTVENGTVIASFTALAGHVTVEDHARISGVIPVHQFVRIGRHSMVGGGSRVPKDILPYVKVAGNPLRVSGLNTIGLRRAGFDPETMKVLREAYRLIFRSELNVTQATERIKSELPSIPEIEHLVEFIETSERGITI
ncbi:MAG: acyl-ACP--UDP-N-acetylglucosamine O-acyltransferase [bacterium]|jgi:UDP-N-acetylglucosamine acyltransferase